MTIIQECNGVRLVKTDLGYKVQVRRWWRWRDIAQKGSGRVYSVTKMVPDGCMAIIVKQGWRASRKTFKLV